MTPNTAQTVWVARLRQRAQMCNDFSRDRGNTRLAADGTETVSKGLGGVAQSAAAAGQSAHSVLDEIEKLESQADSLRQAVRDYLGEVRAG